MSIPYRTRRRLSYLGTFLLVCLLIGCVAWLCWVVWLQRYVVYTDDGASLDFNRSANEITGEVARPPQPAKNISIYYNEGADTMDVEGELAPINGYYITSEMFQEDYDNILLQVERLPAGTPVMIDMKGPFGSFFYSSKLSNALISQSTNIEQVTKLVERMKSKGFYTIARISAFRDRNYGLNNVSNGLYHVNKKGLWPDEENMYWLDPSNAAVTSWISSVVIELRDMGFNEVMLADFRFPDSDKYIFNGDKTEALQKAAATLVSSCAATNFTISFCANDPTFTLPEGRCRLYLENVSAISIDSTVAKVTFEDPEIRLVFLCDSGDTRFDEYSVLRSMNVAEEVEARKGNR